MSHHLNYPHFAVKHEASTEELFKLVLANPQQVFNRLGSEEKYLELLPRFATNPPFASVTDAINS